MTPSPRFERPRVYADEDIDRPLVEALRARALDVLPAQRTRPAGRAVRAQPRAIGTPIVGPGLRLLALGLAIGLVGAVLSSRLLRSLLFEVDAIDPTIYLAVALLLAAAALLACWLPARRASRIDPMIILRAE